jgi:hypothetical protein
VSIAPQNIEIPNYTA